MSKEFSRRFYNSKQWQKTRNAYRQHVRGLCEGCLEKGIINSAEIVHHIIELTPDNINDPKITTGFENLRAVCRECHAIEHGARVQRYRVDDNGKIFGR